MLGPNFYFLIQTRMNFLLITVLNIFFLCVCPKLFIVVCIVFFFFPLAVMSLKSLTPSLSPTHYIGIRFE